jgi:hypothetical protein
VSLLGQKGHRVVLVRAVKACRKSGGITPPILNLGTRWRWVVSFIPFLLQPWGQNTWCPLNGRLSLPQSHSECFGEEINLLPLPGIKPRFYGLWHHVFELVCTGVWAQYTSSIFMIGLLPCCWQNVFPECLFKSVLLAGASIMLSHWCTTSLSLQFWQLQLFASQYINKTKGKPFPFKCSWVSVVSRLWGGWLQNQSSHYGMQRFSRLALTPSLLSGGYQHLFPQLLHGQDKNLTTDINLKLKVKKQTCAFYISMACPCISPGATLLFHHFLSDCISWCFSVFSISHAWCNAKM